MSKQSELVKGTSATPVQRDRRSAVVPACDIYENDDEVLVVADLPGAIPDALDISLDAGELSIDARQLQPAQEGTVLGREYRTADYHRRFSVPAGIDADKISAELKQGVLWLHLPKSARSKPRQIPVSAG